MVAIPLDPSLLAAMRADPGATPVTPPAGLTVAMVGFSDDQKTLRPVSGRPSCPMTRAESAVELPTVTVAADGVTSTRSTGSWLVAFSQESENASMTDARVVPVPRRAFM
jgi:hypothetical protein